VSSPTTGGPTAVPARSHLLEAHVCVRVRPQLGHADSQRLSIPYLILSEDGRGLNTSLCRTGVCVSYFNTTFVCKK
jgi:hypothetical protein